MRQMNKNNKFLKKLSLGTAQFGMNYGVTNQYGKTPYEDIVKILIHANQVGIENLDTAAFYGESEALLGKCLDEIGLSFKVTSKAKINSVNQSIKKSAEQSLTKLKQSSLDVFLLHEAEYDIDITLDKYFNDLFKLKSQGYVKKVGVSVYSPRELIAIVDRYEVDVIQFPFNIFDQRFCQQSILTICKEKKIETQARSIFLQGVLITPIGELPSYFSSYTKYLMNIKECTEKYSISAMELAYSICLANQQISNYIVGCATYDEFVENIVTINHNINLSTSVFDKLSCEDEGLILPFKWPVFN